MPEDEAAARIARLCAGGHVRIGAAFTGRANLYATEAGVGIVDARLVDRLNAIDESITLATVAPFARVAAAPDAGHDQDHPMRRHVGVSKPQKRCCRKPRL